MNKGQVAVIMIMTLTPFPQLVESTGLNRVTVKQKEKKLINQVSTTITIDLFQLRLHFQEKTKEKTLLMIWDDENIFKYIRKSLNFIHVNRRIGI